MPDKRAKINTKFIGFKTMAWALSQQLQGGKYTIEHELGEGGFGITYLAKDNYGRLVVIKTLNDKVQRRPDFAKFQQDFLNEAIKIAKCNHPHIVRIDEVIQEDYLWCIVMEYIDGENLASRVEAQGVLPEVEALLYIQQIGEALMVVHDNGLLHRDIKPQNIMLRADKSEAVLIDFGIAREFSPNLTQTHTQMLSDGFAPIEQYDKRAKRGAYTDVYALAATLYSLLTGEVPTIAPLRAIGTLLEEPKNINSGISDRVNQAILTGMEIKPENRPQSIKDWIALLSLPATIYQFSQSTKITSFSLKAVEQTLAEKRVVNIISSVGINYNQLQDLLATGRWKEADELTKNKMLEVMKLEEQGFFSVEDLKEFPCEDLEIIDQLWVKHSKGRFGFSVQKRIWEIVGGNPGIFDDKIRVDFGEYVGWRTTRYHQILFANWTTREWSYYSQINFNKNAPEGHLPRMWDEWRGGFEVSAIALRLELCKIS